MTLFIVLTAAEAGQVRGPSSTDPMCALDPIVRQGGACILPVTVLSDPAHASHREFLGGLPQLDPADAGFPAALEEA